MSVPIGSALPSVERTALPADVRAGGREAEQAYRAALGFERMLVGELLKSSLPASLGGGAGGDEGADGAGGAYADLVPQTLADSLAAGGGIGLARQLYSSIRPEGS